VEDDSRSGRGGQNPQADRGSAVETHSSAGHRAANCLLVRQGEDGKSFVIYQLTGMGGLPYVVKEPHSVAGVAAAMLTCLGSYRSLGVYREELGPVFACRDGFRK
jgi:hypothetical protein